MATRNELMRFDGLGGVINKLKELIAKTEGGEYGPKLKKVFVEAAGVVADQTRSNIAGLNASPELKEVLAAAVVVNAGPESKSNAIVAMRQQAAVKKFPKDRFIPNPAWFEYGTAPRTTKKGANRGEISSVKPGPFFRPAIQQSKGKATAALASGFKKLILP